MGSEIKILIADDIAAMRGILKRELRESGYEDVTEASNGEDALNKFKLAKYHMAMLDIHMPVKNGVDLFQEMRVIDPSVFVVMVSSDSSAESIKAVLALGVNGFIVKPYSVARIKGVIQKFNDYLLENGLTPGSLP